MPQDADQATTARPKGRKRRIARSTARMLGVFLALALISLWLWREQIADDFIEDALAERGIEASYDIESIGPRKQVLTNIAIGDPDDPDLTIERMEVLVQPRFGLPEIRELRLTGARILGSYRDGQLSFGALDPLIFTGGDGPFEFPDLRLAIDDGRALIVSDYGRVGIKLAGSGHLRGGFAGELAAIAPTLAAGGCEGRDVSLYGAIAIDAERPQFDGPLRFASLDCADSGVSVRDAGITIDMTAERNLADMEGNLDFAAASVDLGQLEAGVSGDGSFAWRDGNLTLVYDVDAQDAATPYADIASMSVEGRLRALQNFSRFEIEGDLTGDDLRMGPQVNDAIAGFAEAGQGTLVEPLLNRFGLSFARALRGSAVEAAFTARNEDGQTSIVIPRANLRGGSGASILAISRAQVALSGGSIPRFSGNIVSGGEGLPYITGRMEQSGNGALQMQLAMREYTAGSSSIAIPRLSLEQARSGGLSINGQAIASGPIPSGFVRELVLPIDGTVSPSGNLALWQSCTNFRFAALTTANLALNGDVIRLCPQGGQPLLRSSPSGMQFAANTGALDLTGQLSGTPMQLAAGAVYMAYPGAIVASNVNVTLGEADSRQNFAVREVRADLSGGNPSGEFTGADITLAALPLDLSNASGLWRYADGQLAISEGSLTVSDRTQPERFTPLITRGASLLLADNIITANALLRHPATDTPLSRVAITHDLASSTGFADLGVDGVTFGNGLQPVDLSVLALGVVANVEGTITGTGRVDWNAAGVTSTGSFSSESLDLAAAFGPVQGASGTVEFTDLLGLTTAPDQRIQVAAVNPGIEVYDGEIAFQLQGGELLAVQGATWPFMGGTLTMRPVDIRFGVEEVRSYVLEIEGLRASQFVDRMELGNLTASGIFDGTIPVIFDAQGNGRLEGGVLQSRPPGGHLSYIGELTYEDMSFFANYAFAALRDLRYDAMQVAMDGPLTGELVTQVRFEGIGQGESAQSNIITRAIADLPIELRINIRAPFYQLISSVRSMYDPSAVRDPRSLGLLSDDGVRLREAVDQDTVDELDAEAEAEAERELLESIGLEPGNEPDIQDQESEDMP